MMPIMNSSIFSSDAAMASSGAAMRQSPQHRIKWTRFCFLALATGLGAILLLLGLAFAIDPYDTGRPGLFNKPGIRPQGPRTAAASRGRDAGFDAAIFGNSHVQLLSPERLNGATNARFVSLIAPATHPKEQLVLLDWFMRHRASSPRAIVLGIDGNWCTGNPALPVEKPFPFWLYERRFVSYAAGLLRFDMLEEAPRRLTYLLARKPERARPDGYWDYEPNYIGLGYDVRPDRRALLEKRQPTIPVNETGRFPAAEQLADALSRIPAATQVVLLHPPVYVSSLPEAHSLEASTDAGCKAAFLALAAKRPNTFVLDWRGDRPQARDAALWFDHTHYRRAIAESIEIDIGKLLGRDR